jgi:hypothetical protein
MAQSKAYDPRTRTTKGIFFIGPGPDGRGLKSKFHTFSYKNILLVFKKSNESDVGPEREGVKSGRGQKRRDKNWIKFCTLLKDGNFPSLQGRSDRLSRLSNA